MTIERLTNILVTVMLIEMMLAIGLGVTMADLRQVARNWTLLGRAILANYVVVPAMTVGLLFAFHPADPTVSVGFLIVAACPGAPFGPPCARIAGGNVNMAVGLMAILAGSSAILAPLLLVVLLPLLSSNGTLRVDVWGIIGALLITQLVPLCIGLAIRRWRPAAAETLQGPANRVSSVLSLATIGLILYTQRQLLAAIDLRAYLGMLILLAASLLAGWILGEAGAANRKTMALTTALRNVGVGLVITAGSFANTAAQTAVLAYGIVEIAGSVAVAAALKNWSEPQTG